MYKWIDENVVYPEEALKNGLEDTIPVEFTVTETGDITNIRINRAGKIRAFDVAAVRVVRAMPKWLPALDENGNPIEAEYFAIVRFRLPKAADATPQ